MVNELDMIFQINNTTPEADTDLVGQLWPRSYELRHLSLVVSLFNLAYLESKASHFSLTLSEVVGFCEGRFIKKTVGPCL